MPTCQKLLDPERTMKEQLPRVAPLPGPIPPAPRACCMLKSTLKGSTLSLSQLRPEGIFQPCGFLKSRHYPAKGCIQTNCIISYIRPLVHFACSSLASTCSWRAEELNLSASSWCASNMESLGPPHRVINKSMDHISTRFLGVNNGSILSFMVNHGILQLFIGKILTNRKHPTI